MFMKSMFVAGLWGVEGSFGKGGLRLVHLATRRVANFAAASLARSLVSEIALAPESLTLAEGQSFLSASRFCCECCRRRSLPSPFTADLRVASRLQKTSEDDCSQPRLTHLS